MLEYENYYRSLSGRNIKSNFEVEWMFYVIDQTIE